MQGHLGFLIYYPFWRQICHSGHPGLSIYSPFWLKFQRVENPDKELSVVGSSLEAGGMMPKSGNWIAKGVEFGTLRYRLQ
jgi:hypothetical protein